jgi:hypothetical protein
MLELRLDTMALDVEAPDLNNGEPALVHCQVLGGTDLPFAEPGTQRPLKIPTVAVSFALTKEAALKFSNMLKEKAEGLPEEVRSSLITAQSLQGVDKLAEVDKKFRG